jgi:hypothetical protein
MKRSPRATPGASRFRQLVDRALFELRLASDVARTEGFRPDVTAPVEASKKNLHLCLDRLAGQAEVGVINIQPMTRRKKRLHERRN